MKINNHLLSIPPYVSTAWKNINSLLVDQSGNLIILMHNNAKIIIPNLEQAIIKVIFDAHAKYLEEDTTSKPEKTISMGLPLKIGMEGIESLGSAMQHNPAQAHSPDLPEEVLNKIASISKIIGMENAEMMPRPEPHCNCAYCQIARAIHGLKKEDEVIEEEEVKEEDLTFKTWDIQETSEKIYTVTNPFDKDEKYTVYLGEPLGCTCGQKNCEHIHAVLNT